MNISENGFSLIKSFEGCRLTAYPDQAGVWTIGWGTITYKRGSHVKQGDVITQDQADEMFADQLQYYVDAVTLKDIPFNQNQFDAAVSFTYNEGMGAFNNAGWVKLASVNVNDPGIRIAWMEWNKIRIDGQLVTNIGLTVRRTKELELYFTPI